MGCQGATRSSGARGQRPRAAPPGLWIGTALALLTACASAPHADFAQLYASRAAVVERPPVIVIPGVMGSRLLRAADGREVWPGRLAALLTGRSFRAVRFPVGDADPVAGALRLRPGGLFDALGGRSFYSHLVRALEDYGGYRCVPASEIGPATDCVLLSWDWRDDFVAGARLLARAVEDLRRARTDPTLRVDIVAHSAGGLLARYYVLYGDRDVLLAGGALPPPAADGHGIDRLVLIGAPNFGSIAAVQQAMFGKPFPAGRAGPEVLATFPGLPQLFPHPELDWMIDADGRPATIDLYSVATWRDSGVGIFSAAARARAVRAIPDARVRGAYLRAVEKRLEESLARGARFQRALAVRLTSSPVAFYVFGSGCSPTPARCLIEHDAGNWALRQRPEDIRRPRPGVDYRSRMLEPGDGSVTKSSLLGMPSLVGGQGQPVFPLSGSVFVCAPHETLPTNATFLDNLLHVLLYRAGG